MRGETTKCCVNKVKVKLNTKYISNHHIIVHHTRYVRVIMTRTRWSREYSSYFK